MILADLSACGHLPASRGQAGAQAGEICRDLDAVVLPISTGVPGGTSSIGGSIHGARDWCRPPLRVIYLRSHNMRNIQGAFARWYNHSFQRRGKFWADRFKSVYLQDKQAVLDCMLYVELNPVRAGLVERPEEWAGSICP